MKRGRPVKSQIRQNIVNILAVLNEGYGYDIYKIYKELFNQCTQKSIYYHLRKGISTGEFIIKKIEKEKGDFSWGSEVEKIYYALGEKAAPNLTEEIRLFIVKRKEQKSKVI